jgi:DNA-binding NtrC family response regulator
MRALIVDDNLACCRAVARDFGASGIDCDCAASIRETESRLRNRIYDLFVVDLLLGEENGNDVIELVAKSNPFSFVVAVTGFATTDLVVEAMHAGADVVLDKPISAFKILSRVDGANTRVSRTLFQIEQKYIGLVINSCNGNKTHAARVLGLTRQGLHCKLQKQARPFPGNRYREPASGRDSD